MSISFPADLDALTNPVASPPGAETLSSMAGGRKHSEVISDLQDAVEAIEAKVGKDGSAVVSSLDYLIAQANAAITALQAVAAGLGTASTHAASDFDDNSIVRGDGGAKGVQGSGIIVDDANNVTGMNTLTLPNSGLHLTAVAGGYVSIDCADTLTGNRSLQLSLADNDRTVELAGDLRIADNFQTIGAFGGIQLRSTAITDVTLPTTGTLATRGGAEALTNKTYNGNTFTAGTGTLTIAAGKTFTASNTLTFTGTDGSTLNIGTGGALGTAAYVAIALYATLASPAFTGVPAAPTAAPGTNTTQLATTAFVTAAVSAAVTSGLEYKGSVDCSANPNYPAGSVGDLYMVSVAGKIGGASGTSVEVGDWYICNVDNAGGTEAAVGSSWGHMEHNLVGALLTANALSELSGVAATARGNLGLGTLATQSGTFSGTSSGTNTGDQTNIAGNAATVTTNANLTGPVTSVGNATTIAAGVVTLAMMADLAQDQFIVRTTASTGVPQTATCTAAARTVLDDTSVAAMVDTLGGATSTGTGGIARATSPTFVTPLLGTPTSGVLTNCTGLTEAGQTLADNTTNDASTTKHGYVPKAPNDTAKFLRGDATWAAAGGNMATDTIWDAKGDLAVGTGANTAARLAVGTDGQLPIADSSQATGILWKTLSGGGSLVSSNTTVPAGNTLTSTSETAFASTYTIPAGSLIAGDVIRVRMHGVYSGTVLPTIRAKAKWGSTTMLDTGALTGLVTGTNLGWWAEMEFVVQTTGAGGTVEAQGYAEFSTAATTGLSVNPINAAAISIDTTAAQAITATVQWGAGGTGQTITLREMVVEKLTAQAAAGTMTSLSSPKGTQTIGAPTGDATSDVNQTKEDSGYIKNLSVACSVASSALTISINTDAATSASATDEIPIAFRNPTATTGTRVHRTLTAASSLVMSSGSTLGFTTGEACAAWLVIFDDGGTLRPGLVNCRSGVNILPLVERQLLSSTAEGGAGAADSAQVIYTGSAVTTKAFRIIARLEWSSGMTAGTWVVPTEIQLFGPGIPLPGQPTGACVRYSTTAADSTTTTTPYDDTPPLLAEGKTFLTGTAITPTCASSIYEIDMEMNMTFTSNGTVMVAIHRDSTSASIKGVPCSPFGDNFSFSKSMNFRTFNGSASATTFKGNAGCNIAGTLALNSYATVRKMGGVDESFIQVKEIQT